MVGVISNTCTWVVRSSVGIIFNLCDGRNLPAGDHTIFGVVSRAYIIVVGQLHLVVVIVETVEVLICTLEC